MDRDLLSRAQRADLAARLAAERLETANRIGAEVHPKNSFYTKYGKRAIDFTVAFAAMAVTLPINLVIGVVTFFDVGKPIFFMQDRIGKDGKLFKIVKFRNMTNATNEAGELLPPSQRVTKWGKFVRKTSLDELLNFWSILKGDMSLIGPRPLPPSYLERFSDRHMMRHAVRPGLECPPREKGVGVRGWHEQFENDIWYVENVSFLNDCKLLIRLVQYALDRKNVAARAGAKRGSFVGYDWEGRAINYRDVPQSYIDYYDNENTPV